MNVLSVGKNPEQLLPYVPNDNFLVIDDGPFIDRIDNPHTRFFDVSKHCFNPLKNVDHRRARQIAQVIYAVYPQGENTLTVRNGKRALARLVFNARRLDKLEQSDADDVLEANAAVDDLLFSPVARNVLCGRPNFSLKGTIAVKLDRTQLDEQDCFIIANFLIANFNGTVIIPDFGFYGCAFHASLVRQDRLIAGVRYLDESKLTKSLLQIEEKVASRCLPEDAKVLAEYKGLYNDPAKRDNEYTRFIQTCLK